MANVNSRLEKYKYYRNLLKGEQFEAFRDKIDSSKFNQSYGGLNWISYNLLGRISELYSDLIFGSPITIKTSNPELTDWLNALVKSSGLDTQLAELAITTSADGDGVLRVITSDQVIVGEAEDKAAKRDLLVQTVDPSRFHPETNTGNFRQKPKKINIIWEETKKRGTKDVKFKIVETHIPGEITYSIFNGKTELTPAEKEMLFPEYVDTELNSKVMTVVHIPNKRVGGYWGVSDYADIDNLIFSYGSHATGVSEVITKMIDPIKTLPRSLYSEIQQAKMQEKRRAGDPNPTIEPVTPNDLAKYKVIFSGDDDAKPSVITWDAQLTSAFTLMDKLEAAILKVKSIPKYLLDDDASGGGAGEAQSGIALERRMIGLRKTIERKERYYREALESIFYSAQVLSINSGGQYTVAGKSCPVAEAEIPTIEFANSLPIDPLEVVTLENTKVVNGFTTEAEAISKVNNISLADAEVLAKKIRAENESKLRSSFNGA